MEDLAKVYVTIVAIPRDFDVSLYMSPAEQAGYFEYEHASFDQIEALSAGVCNSPVLRIDSAKIKEASVRQFIQVIDDIGLLIDVQVMSAEINTVFEAAIQKALSAKTAITAIEALDKEKTLSYMRRMKFLSSFLFINIFPLINEKVVQKYVTKAVELEEWRKE